MENETVVFSAVTSSVRQIYLLLRSIQFTTKTHVNISESGIHFLTEDARVMQGTVLIERNMFSSYTFIAPSNGPDGNPDAEDEQAYSFQINLSAFLETLQVLGSIETRDQHIGRDRSGIYAAIARGGPASALSNRVLGTSGICRLKYQGEGSALSMVLEEGNITTTCSLATYESDVEYDGDIPLQRDRLNLKIIMRSSLLLNAITELDSASPARLTIAVASQDPNLTLSAIGPHSSASIEFGQDKHLLETFNCGGAISNSYRFSMIKAASRAMAMSSKVSIRADENGVLSLQFLVEGNAPGKLSFIDFRYAALLDDDDDNEHEREDHGTDERRD